MENNLQLFSKNFLQHEIIDIAYEIKHTHKNIIFLKRDYIYSFGAPSLISLEISYFSLNDKIFLFFFSLI